MGTQTQTNGQSLLGSPAPRSPELSSHVTAMYWSCLYFTLNKCFLEDALVTLPVLGNTNLGSWDNSSKMQKNITMKDICMFLLGMSLCVNLRPSLFWVSPFFFQRSCYHETMLWEHLFIPDLNAWTSLYSLMKSESRKYKEQCGLCTFVKNSD